MIQPNNFPTFSRLAHCLIHSLFRKQTKIQTTERRGQNQNDNKVPEATELRPIHSRQGEFQIDKTFFSCFEQEEVVGSLYTYFFTPRIILDH